MVVDFIVQDEADGDEVIPAEFDPESQAPHPERGRSLRGRLHHGGRLRADSSIAG
jgi:hypothetical protein